MNIIEYADRDMLAIDVANQLAGDLKTHLLHHDSASFAVAGGTTPAPIFDDLCAADIDWARVRLMATDERWVPVDSDRSNARMIRERLLVNRAAAATFLPFHVPARAPEDVLAEVESQVQPELPLSVVLLGMGEDMHTASLFPGVDGLTEALAADAPVLAVMRPDSQPEPRVSLSARVLDAAIAKHLVIYGDAKREALEIAKSLPPEDAPIQAVLSEMTVHWAP
ncbi:6-phosphogluconolactonase [Phaeobacter gallaeciensis]|uniref:6-phosphogluconolactonase n=1 Tax=Phaeobacter gallaeciensis TaxID=60890 RepID=A0AAD0ED34_9RHOB|nr:6-phosphogluconolactonase [Phaeobacter gallaeciensis]AHD09637.1 6-phosphogluconolactonase [Phaeobacter gallaeciensis DSM 26640]ATE92901.1 6-phosphogluconolactonase Pgl [Phaeobacter gallaeciensis]ATE97277.1 6-phosphogluconolactonase Pgl [Phaeobacter gallaeciensis]ATF01566.1 6-phosphogluconolactonase Pgl [Phaeobacter gallaeciensis]ATF05946.1 6-phosphogluconolactonase Pgl [Phaeobacter gallaeciensis]